MLTRCLLAAVAVSVRVIVRGLVLGDGVFVFVSLDLAGEDGWLEGWM